jgi:hypothetical protein
MADNLLAAGATIVWLSSFSTPAITDRQQRHRLLF